MLPVVLLALMRRPPAGASVLLAMTRVLLAVTRGLLGKTRVALAMTRVPLAVPQRHFDVRVVPRISRSVCEHGSVVG